MDRALRANIGKIIVSRESTSGVSETIDALNPGQVLDYENAAMNEVHKAHLASELAASRISILRNYQELECPALGNDKPKNSAANVIAQRLWELANL